MMLLAFMCDEHMLPTPAEQKNSSIHTRKANCWGNLFVFVALMIPAL